MTKRIFRSICLVAVSVFLASVALFMGVLYDYFTGVQQAQLRMQTSLAAQGVLHEGADYFDGLDASNYRITWIAEDGTVLYDSKSDSNDMENHLRREEVDEAIQQGIGESKRYSKTLLERSLYCAQKLGDGTVLRLSVAQSSLITLMLGMLQPMCVIFVIAMVLSLALASRLSKKIVKPLNQLNLDDPLSNDGYDELAPLLRRLNAQQRQIKRQSEELAQKQREFETVTTGMTEGLVLLNGQRAVLSMNPAAQRLFNTNAACVGQMILSINRSPELQELLMKAGKGKYAETVMELNGGKYQLDASPILSAGRVSGTVLLLMDVTEKERTEQLRREFTANVSHELKTPLHTISGCAELMENGIVKPEDQPRFAKQIYTEAQRMIHLVEDIIKLSHLDEGADDMKKEEVDLYAVARDAVGSLMPAARSANVTLEVDGEVAAVYGIPQLLHGIVYNLCDNAIKYNRPGGKVDVSVQNQGQSVCLTVADTGIGIPAEHQERIFERFYRVDKSHSKEIGGTGLGLSIVKHAARLHDAAIEVQSEPGKGTTIQVIFPAGKMKEGKGWKN